MKKYPFLLTLSAFIFFNFCNQYSIDAQIESRSKSFESSIDSIFADKKDLSKPGASVIILKGEKVLLSKSYGSANLAFDRPFSENTLFPLPNFTDQLVAFSILQLDKKGIIKLTDPVNKYLPDLGFNNSVTIDHLLNHSSDFPFLLSMRLMAGWKFSDPLFQEDFIKLAKEFTHDLKPDTKIGHIHSGIKILQMLVENVSEMDFSDYASIHIFKPLGMNNSFIKNKYFKEDKNSSFGYEEVDGKYQRVYFTELAIICPMTYSTQNDFEKWMINIQTKKFEGDIIKKMDNALSLKGVAQKQKNGSYCIGQQQYYKYNEEDGYLFRDEDDGHSWLWRRLQQSNISVMVIGNLDESQSNKINAILSLLTPTITDSVSTNDANIWPIKLSKQEMDARTGFYWDEEYLYTTEICIRDGELYHSDKDYGYSFALVPITKSSFRTPYGGVINFSNIGADNKTIKNITTAGSVFTSKQFDATALTKVEQLKYVGTYNSVKLNVFYSIIIEENKLILRRSRKPDLEMTSLGNNRFRVSEIDFRLIEFDENEKGTIERMKISTTILRDVGFEKL